MEPDEIKNYLPIYWKAIESLWQECVGQNATKYSLQRTNGTIVFHWLFPFVYFKSKSLGAVKLKSFIEILQPIRKKYGSSFWERGGEAKLYTSKSSQKTLVDKMIAATFPSGKGVRLAKFKGREDSKEEKTWEIASSKLFALRLFHLFTSDKLSSIDAGATGVYVLYSFKNKKFYVGRSEKADLKTRLQSHLQNKENEFHIFNYRLCKEPKEAHDLECALYHLVPSHLRLNKEHPSAFEGRKCIFCAISD